ncbi:inositol hexakisphosphate and diphosphoinositol-pentakisphosphate kinase 2-like isoform X2 [Asterias rubens]|uniref:inositol hexakisphosphate and diphosphoinositol-pentakisphosphate kinase 2-like isoform X2 n=1 Tax=Asterias rubens TaxID=7604 RepID=UPI0014558495|nr:inositol hexakisphosphate and diphosphoinositol-pentakisphosphate kinase 2-like isoform X2 [Asterias rubens]
MNDKSQKKRGRDRRARSFSGVLPLLVEDNRLPTWRTCFRRKVSTPSMSDSPFQPHLPLDECQDELDMNMIPGWDTSEVTIKGTIGICAMAKKSSSKPMREILTRLEIFEHIEIIIFKEEVILNDPVEEWPICDCLVSFFSQGFPLEKAIDYAKLRKPLVINDLEAQYNLLDRRKVYRILYEQGIAAPRFVFFDRDKENAENMINESDDQIEICGHVFQKPFVEKPVSAEDHNIYIYYPSSAGGGSQRLFRKIGSRSSFYSQVNVLRQKGSYIYEEFMPTDGTDVKVYTVGPDYAHAEARKSPALDGKVERDSEGKEVRYPVILSNHEKLIARKVCLAFKQSVCGFDLLRANGKSYVCDVNGFSFVKNSKKYYDDCAKILGNLVMRELAPKYNIPWQMFTMEEEIPYVPTTSGTVMELRCVIAVIRHGDRTPKQKMKMEVKHPKFFKVFEKYGGFDKGKIKLKRPKQLQEVLDVARYLLEELKRQKHRVRLEIEERQSKLEQLKAVLEMYGHFSGINRKVQFKYQPHGQPRHSSSEEASSDCKADPSLLLILKWGGELTPAGRDQAEELGRAFRCIYPGGQGEYAGFPGCGLLRLHSTYRHDLKIYASDEGRVQMTAAAFTKGMLALEGELTPILVQMVKSANTNGLLDHEKDSVTLQGKVKEMLYERFRKKDNFTEEDKKELSPTGSRSLQHSLSCIENPTEMCVKIYNLMKRMTKQIRQCLEDEKSREEMMLYHNESLDLMLRRWAKLEKDFKTKLGVFDITKIPDIYDCIKYDLLHNEKIISSLGFTEMGNLYLGAQLLADVIIPQEYGITAEEKLEIGTSICTPLLRKIRADLQRINSEEETTFRLNPKYSKGVLSPDRHVRTRLYFTSESHIHSLLSCLRYGNLCSEMSDSQWARAMQYLGEVKELNYMTQIVLMLYEDPSKEPMSDERFRVELHFSPGAKGCDFDSLPTFGGYRSVSKDGDMSPTDQLSENDEDSTFSNITTTSDSPQCTATSDDFTPTSSQTALDQDSWKGGSTSTGDLDARMEAPSMRVGISIKESSRPSSGPASIPSRASFNTLTDIAEHDDSLSKDHQPDKGLLGVHSAPNLRQADKENPGDANWVVSQEELLRRASHFSAQGIPLDHQMQVPSILPLETLHNCLSLKQIDHFLERFTQNGAMTPESTTPRQSYQLNTFTPRRVLPTPLSFGRESDGSLYSRSTSNPSSNTSSALPSPTENNSQHFDFMEFMDKVKRKDSLGKANRGNSLSDQLPDGYVAEDESQDGLLPRSRQQSRGSNCLDEPMETETLLTPKGLAKKRVHEGLTVDTRQGDSMDADMQDLQTPTNI